MGRQDVEGQTEANVCKEQRDRQYHAAPRSCQQLDFRTGRVHIAEPLQDRRQQPTMPPHIITHYPVQMTNGPLLWTDKSIRDPSMKQHLSVSQQEQVHPLVKDQVGQQSVTETQLPLHVSETQKDSRLIARERRKLRTHRRKKPPKEQQVHAARTTELSYARCSSETNNVGKPLNMNRLSEDKHVIGGSQHPHVVARADHDKSQLEVKNDSTKSIIIDFQRDESVEHQNHQPIKAHTEPEKTTSSVKGRTRVSHLKREACLKNADTVEKKHELQWPVGSPSL